MNDRPIPASGGFALIAQRIARSFQRLALQRRTSVSVQLVSCHHLPHSFSFRGHKFLAQPFYFQRLGHLSTKHPGGGPAEFTSTLSSALRLCRGRFATALVY